MNKYSFDEHINFINNMADDSASNKECIDAFKRFLTLLPNKGKLYKYKSGEGKSFSNTFKSLRHGYVWMSNVNNFNDRFDSTINFDYCNALLS